MDDYDIQFQSSLSPKIDRNKKLKSKGPTVLSLKKHFRKSLLLDQSQQFTPNISISVIEISSSDSGCSKQLNSSSKIIIDESNSEGSNSQHSNISSNLNSDNGEIIPPSPNNKKITYECLSTSRKKELHKTHYRDLPKTKLSDIMQWVENVDRYNEKVIENGEIQLHESIEETLVTYDEFENKTKTDGNQMLNSTMLPNPMINYKNENCYSEIQQITCHNELDSKFDCSTSKAGNFNKSCEDLLDELYGTSWRLRRDEVLSKSEKKPRRKKATEKDTYPKSERKFKKLDYNGESQKLNNLLKTLQIKKAIDFQSTEDIIDGEQYDEKKRDILNCNPPKKSSVMKASKFSEKEINHVETDNTKTNDRNYKGFSDKENDSSRNIKLKKKEKFKNVKANTIKDKTDTQTTLTNKKEIPNKLFNVISDTKDILCHKKNDENFEGIDKVKKTRKQLTEIDSHHDKFAVDKVGVVNKSEETKYSFLASLSKNIPDSHCNTSAKIFRTTYKQQKEVLAEKLFYLYNKKIFNNALPAATILEWNSRMSSTAGFCCSKKITHRSGNVERVSKIILSSKVLDSADRLRDTLIHEMCHAATWVVDEVSNGHGEYWIAWTNKAREIFPELPPIKRCHNYQINTKYVYRCTGCGYSIGRHRKSLNVERKRCGYCLGKFEILINKINKKGEHKTVPVTPKREPTGFALFVKENYSQFKEPGVNHGGVMKLLSEKFNEMKV